MAIALLYTLPRDQRGWHDWSFSNADSHVRIVEAIQRQYGQTLSSLVLDPIPWHAIGDWLRNHFVMHAEMDSVLGIDSSDLTIPDFTDRLSMEAWVLQHADEHRDAENQLGL
ncbi:MAG TPA: hypothetical protein VGR84_18930 [Candidatus Acidoferrales bacterium]|nr:hypothetical protein [Candidatus Acidoferrales bacterium]